MKVDLKGKTILLTGASKGIGAAIANFLIENDARLAIHYHTDEESAVSIKQKCENGSEIFQADLEDEESVFGLFEEVKESFGKIDVIILNAGVFLPHTTSLKSRDWLKTFKKTVAINLTSTGILTKLGIEHFKNNGGGRFIYIGSRAVFRGETEEYLGYAASKGGLTSLARSVARAFGKDNIKSFIIAPGFTKTQMAEQFIAEHGEDRILNEISLKEITKPEDIAPITALMCSGMMDHATGATIDINAGSHIR